MPLALLIAQLTAVAQMQDFVTAVLVISSIAPVQVYLNEVFAPRAVRYNRSLDTTHAVEVALATFLLSAGLVYWLELSLSGSISILLFAQGYIWFSYAASRRILSLQAEARIGGRYSYILGSIIPLTFLLLVCVVWAIGLYYLTYLLILLPNLLQYLFVRFGWEVSHAYPDQRIDSKQPGQQRRFLTLYFGVAMAMAMVAQYWKVKLADAALGFAALSVYLIVPFSSAWLIFSKTRYLTGKPSDVMHTFFWGSPILVFLTLLFVNIHHTFQTFLLALVAQVLTFKFITETRSRLSTS